MEKEEKNEGIADGKGGWTLAHDDGQIMNLYLTNLPHVGVAKGVHDEGFSE